MEEAAGAPPGTRAPRGTRAKIARQTGLDAAVVSDFLNNQRDNVKGETFEAVADKMRLDLRWFFDVWPDGVVRQFTEYLKRPRSAREATSSEDDAEDDLEDDLRDLNPTDVELRAWERHLRKHRYPRISAVKRAFILGRRDGQVRPAIDTAVNKIAEELAKENATKRGV